MKQHLFLVAVLAGVVALPAMARAQHSRPADAPPVATAQPVYSPPPPPPAPAPSFQPAPTPSQPAFAPSSGTSGSTQPNSGSNAPSNNAGRRRGDLPTRGTATPRTTPAPGDTAIVGIDGGAVYPPWEYGAGGAIVGFGGYYNGYLGPDDQGPWSPLTYSPGVSISDDEGAIRLKVKPADASVYIDGFYVGVVDDFDGAFQRLRIDAGPHRIEMRSAGLQTLSVDVVIQPDLTITYRGELKP